MFVSRWLAIATLTTALAIGSLTPSPVQAQDGLTRVIVDIADVVLRGNQPYYRYGSYRQQDQLVMGRDRYGRPVYYRVDGYGRPANSYGYRSGYQNRYGGAYGTPVVPYGNAYGYYGRNSGDHHGANVSYGRSLDRHHRPQYSNGHRSNNRRHHGD